MDDTLRTHDGLKLTLKSWPTSLEIKARILIVHGLAEHSGRYETLAREFNQAGLLVYSYDARGHGQSEGDKCYVEDFDHYLKDLNAYINMIKNEHPNTPLFLMGHSAGGEVVAVYALKFKPDLAGVILSSPALKPGDDISPVLISLSGIMNKLAPRLKVLALDPNAISRLPDEVVRYKNDPLNYHGKIPTSTGYQLQQNFKVISNLASQFDYPLYIYHGTGDKLTNVDGSREFFNHAKSKDKTLKLYEGGYHELIHDSCKDEVKAELISWIENHLNS